MLTKIYPDAPDYRQLSLLVDELRDGAVFIYPTSSGYAYCCDAFKFIKDHEVNYTFILPASGALPKIFKQRKEVGVRLAQHPIGRLLAEHLGNPLITSSLPLENEEEPEYCTNPELIDERYGHGVRTILDAGDIPLAPSTIVDCTEEPFEVLRYGHGRLEDEEPLLKKD